MFLIFDEFLELLKTTSQEEDRKTSPNSLHTRERLSNFFYFSEILQSRMFDTFCCTEAVDEKTGVDSRWLKNIKGQQSCLMGHLFNQYAKFLNTKIRYNLLSPDTHAHECVSRGKKLQFSGQFCAYTKWMIPYSFSLNVLTQKIGYMLSRFKIDSF